jgi:hypothetical protein
MIRALPAALVAALAVAGCALAPAEPPAPAPAPQAQPEPKTPAAAPPAPQAAAPVRPAPSRKPRALPVRPLNVATDCRFADGDGYGGSLRLDVAESTVRVFEARVEVPKRGRCEFVLRDFVQTASLPSVRLSSPGSRCAVHMWEQEEWVTVAFTDCDERCTPAAAFQHVWPIIAERASGGCR